MAKAKAIVIAVGNMKGGVGKTTTAVNLAACLVDKGFRVLVCDLDQQGGATATLGVDPAKERQTMFQMFQHCVSTRSDQDSSPMDISPYITRITTGEHLLAANHTLAVAERTFSGELQREKLLLESLEGVRELYDYIILDCPPTPGFMVENAMVAADFMLIPVVPEIMSADGLALMMNSVRAIRRINTSLLVLGVLITKVNGRLNHHREVAAKIREYCGTLKIANQPIEVIGWIPEATVVKEATGAHQAVTRRAPLSTAAMGYSDLTDYVLSATTSIKVEDVAYV